MKFYIIVALGILTRVVSNEELKCKPRPGCHFSGCDPTAGPSFIVLDRNEYPLTCEATDIREMIAQNEKNFRYLMNITLGRFQQTSKLTHEIQNLKRQLANLTLTNNELIQDFNKFVAETMSRLEKLETEIARSDPISVNILKTPQSSSTVPILASTIQSEEYPRSFHCDFQEAGNTCGLVNDDDKSDQDWIQHFGALPAKFSGPTNPTLNSHDGYMYVDAAPQDSISVYAYLLTPKLAPGNYCIQIRIFMTTNGIGAFGVGVAEFKGPWRWKRIVKEVYAHSFVKKSWMVIRQEYTSEEELDFIEVVFEGWRSSKESRFDPTIAIDDIRIVQEKC